MINNQINLTKITQNQYGIKYGIKYAKSLFDEDRIFFLFSLAQSKFINIIPVLLITDSLSNKTIKFIEKFNIKEY